MDGQGENYIRQGIKTFITHMFWLYDRRFSNFRISDPILQFCCKMGFSFPQQSQQVAQGQQSLTCQYMLNLYKISSTTVPDANYQVSRQLAQWFWRRRFFKVFAIYGHGGHLGHVTWTKYINFVSRFAWRLHMKFNWNWPSSFRGEVVDTLQTNDL